MEDLKRHWETVYETKAPSEVSWTQERPLTSLAFIEEAGLPLDAPIIDIGGGDSRLVDHLLEMGYTDVTVLDISQAAIDRARARLGAAADSVKWVVSDIRDFVPDRQYALWHDRATFHFLTQPEQVAAYVGMAAAAVDGFMTIGTFSKNGPTKCSGLPVQQYSEEQLAGTLNNAFIKVRCAHEDHLTPFNTVQNFLFCNFKKAS